MGPPAARASRNFEPGLISTELWEWRISFTPSRLQAYWSTSVGWWPGTRERAEIKTLHWLPRSGWSQPVVAQFSGEHADMDPFVSPDGLTLYFSSMRPVEGGEKLDMDLWMVRRTRFGWGQPVHLGDVSIDGYDELYPSADFRGNLYFARVKAPVPTDNVNIWRSERRLDGSYAPPELLGPGVNTAERWEYNPEISPDGRVLLFARMDFPSDALPDAGFGYGDLHVSYATGSGFSAGQNLGPCVNTAGDEFHPTVLWEHGVLFFARDIGFGGDFYRTLLKLPH